MSSNPIHPTAQAQECRAVLARAWQLRRAGLHTQAINCLDDAMRTGLQHDEAFAATALALKARSQVHIMDEAGAMLSVSLVPMLVRRFNPKVDAHCQIVKGLVYRRRAYRSWKAGAPDLSLLDAAIDCFARARSAAESGIEQRLACAAELNQLYAQGLQASIEGRSQERNPQLVVAAIEAEAKGRSKTPLEDAAHVAGLTIIADLAIGARLQPRDLFDLAAEPSFRSACRALFRIDAGPWPHELLRAATAVGVPVEQKARALVLGGRCLTRRTEGADEDLVRAYLVHLTDCDCTLNNGVHDGAAGSRAPPFPGLSGQIALLRGMLIDAFPGRRIFR